MFLDNWLCIQYSTTAADTNTYGLKYCEQNAPTQTRRGVTEPAAAIADLDFAARGDDQRGSAGP